MGHDRLKTMKDTLMAAVEGQLCNIHEVDAKELGEAIDMIKDLEEAIYYCVIVEAMEEKDEEKEHYPQQMMYYPQRGEGMNYFHERYPMQEPYYRDMDREGGRMYYNGNGRGGGGSNGTSSNSSSGNGNGSSSSNGGNGTSYFGGDWSEREYPFDLRDYREGRSPKSRKMYMESKEMHKDKASHLRELEKYMQELTTDIVEMIEDASAEEKQYLEKKIASLAQKISQLNA